MRAQLRLPALPSHPGFGPIDPQQRILALYSPLLGVVQPDYPQRTAVVGFPLLTGPDRPEQVSPELQKFLDADSPPVVFTLGTAGIYRTAEFVLASDRAAARLGVRAAIIVDTQVASELAGSVSSNSFICGYVPYAQLFPHATAIVHHGGVGTIAQALLAGRPQLAAWSIADQPDNGRRLARLGVGRELSLARYIGGRAEMEVAALLRSARYRERAGLVAKQIAQEEDGVSVAARFIEEAVSSSRS
jgi:UDP:flavonoid glycosyltransferase YjiC (YdhE family)